MENLVYQPGLRNHLVVEQSIFELKGLGFGVGRFNGGVNCQEVSLGCKIGNCIDDELNFSRLLNEAFYFLGRNANFGRNAITTGNFIGYI